MSEVDMKIGTTLSHHVRPRARRFAPALVACSLLIGFGCRARSEEARRAVEPQAAQQSQQQPQPLRVTADDLKRLRWIEGAWRGTGDVEKPFFESYRFESETTLAVESFADETLGKADDVTRFELREGIFGNFGEGARWAATALDENSITFSPVAKARNTFRWQRESANVWRAVLDYPVSEGKPARQRIYRMERIPPSKKP